MNWIQKFIAYYKDNPKGYWFKVKLYGWGWMPVKWQGWLVVIIFITGLIQTGFDLAAIPYPSNADFLIFFAKIIVATIIVIGIAYWKGEKPHWQWGLPDKYKTKK